MKLKPNLVCAIHFFKLFNTMNEEFQFLKYLFENLDVLIVDRLMQKVIETETTSNYEHEAFVKLACNVKQQFIVVL